MVEIQNKTLAGLLVVAIVISLVGTFGSLSKLNQLNSFPLITGMGVASGEVKITINTSLDVSFVDASIDFGTGNVNSSAGDEDCTMIINFTGGSDQRYDEDNSGGCGGSWANFAAGSETALRIENIGNADARINVTSDVTAATLIGGTAPAFKWVAEHYEATSCKANLSPTTYTSITTTEITLCDNLSFLSYENSISLGFLITIDENTTMVDAGEQTATITLQGIAV